eukprot:scaffold433_cov257-Pinguiococcus_pyrenoidosus.AAC.14
MALVGLNALALPNVPDFDIGVPRSTGDEIPVWMVGNGVQRAHVALKTSREAALVQIEDLERAALAPRGQQPLICIEAKAYYAAGVANKAPDGRFSAEAPDVDAAIFRIAAACKD